jgi:diguanylate cyclase (GGDEF)-like protein
MHTGAPRPVRDWLATVLGLATALGLFLAWAGRLPGPGGVVDLPAWAVALLALGAERVELRSRWLPRPLRLGEPLGIAGLFLAGPGALVGGRLAGLVLAESVLPGRRSPSRVAADGARLALGSCAALLTFDLFAGYSFPWAGPTSWAAAGAAAVATEIAELALAALERRLAGQPRLRHPPGQAARLTARLGQRLLVADVALVVVAATGTDLRAALLLAGPVAALAALSRAAGRDRPTTVERLTEAMATLRLAETPEARADGPPPGPGELLGELAAWLLWVFGARTAEVVVALDGVDGTRSGLRSLVRAGAGGPVAGALRLEAGAEPWAGLAPGGVLTAPDGTEQLAAVLPGPAGPRGLLLVSGGATGPEERRLLHAVAEYAAVALDNASLRGDLLHQARHDPLTGLPNRAMLADRLTEALRRTRPVAVIFIDLDGFKAVNDRLGHHAGDQLLVAAGRRMRAALRTGDMLARFAGDEFVVVSEGLGDATAAARVAERLLAALTPPFQLGEREGRVAASIGVAIGRGPDDTPDDLLRRADTAMYAAKEAGKGRWHLAEPEPAGPHG